MGKVLAVEAITLNFLMELNFTGCSMGFGEIRFYLDFRHHINDSNS